MKKGQIQSQLFIYILTIIIIGAILVFGVNWIMKLMKDDQCVQETQMIAKINQDFKSIRSDFGSSIKVEIVASPELERVCFVDHDTNPNNNYDLCKPGTVDYSPIMCNSWQDHTSGILFSPTIACGTPDIGEIVVGVSGYLCFNTDQNRRIRLRLTGLGDRVKVEEQ